MKAIERSIEIEHPDAVRIPDSTLAKQCSELVRDTESDLLYSHSSRVFLFAAASGKRRVLPVDPELLYIAAMFHDMGLTRQFASADQRFEVDGANAARDFLRSRSIPEQDVYDVWTAIALHTTPGVPEHMHSVVALLTAGVEMDVLGIGYDDFPAAHRQAIVSAFPRTPHFKEDIIQAFYDAIKLKPKTTFGNVKADVLADKDPTFTRINFCDMIRSSRWSG